MKFNEKLKELRISKKLTQEDIANQLHISRQSVSKWEQGINEPDIQTLKQLCILLEVSIEDLIDDDQDVVLSREEKKRKISKKLFITQIFIFACNILNILCMLRFLPSRVPVKYNFKGVTSYGSKFTYLIFLIIPIIVLLVTIGNKLLTNKNKYYKKHIIAMHVTFLVIQIIAFIGSFVTMLIPIKFDEITYIQFVTCEIAIILLLSSIAISPIFNKTPNFFAGFRTNFTLSNKEAWYKINMLQSSLGAIAASIMLVISLVANKTWIIYSVGLLILSVLITYIYHEILRHKFKKTKKI